ncbi:hypothetical protein V4R08_05525 [Nitrobacter sp. NHB1]|uniref:hypothetical protein n=1 Tax=Nitrobacter sp. NHB1 TaxID=3119830 RepID=UPI002FFECA95
MFKFFEKFKGADTALSLGGWVWSAFLLITGLTGATVMGWALSQLSWFWEAFRWAGVLGAGLITWILIGIGLRLYQPIARSSRKAKGPPQRIRGKVFTNEEVMLSGFEYYDCEFRNVTLVYDGGIGGIVGCRFHGFMFKSNIPEVETFVRLLHDLGMLKIPVFQDGQTLKPSNPFPAA